MNREARCLCGNLRIKVEGAPMLPLACNCTNCQRRTGSAFGLISYFSDSQIVSVRGDYQTFQFKVDNGNTNTTSFCPKCGSTVFFKAEMFKGKTGIAMGCFTDSEMPEPALAVWTRSKHRWVVFPEHWQAMEQQTP